MQRGEGKNKTKQTPSCCWWQREAGNWICVEEIAANARARHILGGEGAGRLVHRLLHKVAPWIIWCCKNLIACSFLITTSSVSSFSKPNHVSMLVKLETMPNYQTAPAAGVSCKHTTVCTAAEARTWESSDTIGFSFSRCWNNAERRNLCEGGIQKQATEHW